MAPPFSALATTSMAGRRKQGSRSLPRIAWATAARATSGATRWGMLFWAAALLSAPGTISAVRNPLAAAGGVDPENMNHIVQYAPFSYQNQLRCVTEADYGDAAAQSNSGPRSAWHPSLDGQLVHRFCLHRPGSATISTS